LGFTDLKALGLQLLNVSERRKQTQLLLLHLLYGFVETFFVFFYLLNPFLADKLERLFQESLFLLFLGRELLGHFLKDIV
jgi:hypothetical protein